VVLNPRGWRLHRLADLARRYDVVGWVRCNDERWDEDRYDEVRGAVERVVEHLMGEIIQHLADGVAPSLRVRLETTLLRYAADHLKLVASPNGAVIPSVVRPVAQAILDLPLFVVEPGYAAPTWQLVTEFCSYGVAAFDASRGTIVGRLAASPPAPHLWAWVRDNLHEGRVARPGSTDRDAPHRPLAEARRAVSLRRQLPDGQTSAVNDGERRLIRSLAAWLLRLRPDPHLAELGAKDLSVELVSPIHGLPPMIPGVLPPEALAGYLERSSPTPAAKLLRAELFLNREHWLVRPCIDREQPEDLAWLLLACYAHINDVIEPVSNDHERAFQERVFTALRSGALAYVEAVEAPGAS
jgi:hypothetical protein